MTPNGKYLVYLVEDDAIYLKTLHFFLNTKLGEQVDFEIFSNGEACVSALDHKPDLVVLDYFLDPSGDGNMNGLDTLKAIKKERANLTVVMLSGQEKYGVAAQTIAGGAVHYIRKTENAAEELVDYISNFVKQ